MWADGAEAGWGWPGSRGRTVVRNAESCSARAPWRWPSEQTAAKVWWDHSAFDYVKRPPQPTRTAADCMCTLCQSVDQSAALVRAVRDLEGEDAEEMACCLFSRGRARHCPLCLDCVSSCHHRDVRRRVRGAVERTGGDLRIFNFTFFTSCRGDPYHGPMKHDP